MNENYNKHDLMFSQLVISLQMGAMQQMGKVASPITGKIERDLQMAQASIDMLEMLQVKTKGNLSEEETKLLERVLYELRLNYVDESNKGDDKSDETEKPAEKDEEKPTE